MAKRLAIVAVESNLVGRTARPAYAQDGPMNHAWPFQIMKKLASGATDTEYTETEAEIVAVYVGDLDEGGVLKLMIRAKQSRMLKTVYESVVKVD